MGVRITTDDSLTSIANAIRTKGGTSAQLTFPSGFVSAIENIQTGGGGGEYAWAGRNATLVKTADTITKKLSETDYATWTPATSQKTILASQSVGAFTLSNIDEYDYYILQEFLYISAFKSGATLQNTVERFMSSHLALFTLNWSETSYSDFNNGLISNIGQHSINNSYSIVYYNGNSEKTNTANQTGPAYVTTPSYSRSGTYLTLKASAVYSKCNSTYFATSRASELDQENSKFSLKIKIIRVDRPSPTSYNLYNLYNLYHGTI